jgi:hypothetical protein
MRSIRVVLFSIHALAAGDPFEALTLNPAIPTGEHAFVEVARYLGVPSGGLSVRHILPNALNAVIVTATLYPGAVISIKDIGAGLREALNPRRTLSREPGAPHATSQARQASRGVRVPCVPRSGARGVVHQPCLHGMTQERRDADQDGWPLWALDKLFGVPSWCTGTCEMIVTMGSTAVG